MSRDGYYREVAAAQFAGEGAGAEASHMDRLTRLTARGSELHEE